MADMIQAAIDIVRVTNDEPQHAEFRDWLAAAEADLQDALDLIR